MLFAIRVVGVQKLVCPWRIGAFKELGIKLLYLPVVMGLPEVFLAINGIEGLLTDCRMWLIVVFDTAGSTAVNAAARAGHDFDEVIGTIACKHLFNDFTGIFEPVTDGNVDLRSVAEVYDGFSNTVKTTQRRKFDLFEFRTIDGMIDRAYRCFHNTAGRSENGSGSSGFAHERIVKIRGLQLADIDSLTAKKPGKFSDGQYHIDIGVSTTLEVGAGGLILFCRTGHDGNDADLVGGNFHLFREIGARQRAKDLLW